MESIFALSPQAKGRIERLWGTLQDRLVAELRLAGASTLEEANRVLWEFLPRFNARFGVPAAQPGQAYRPPGPGLDLQGVLCFKYQRTVARDNTVRFGGRTLQLLPDLQRCSYAHARVEVQERLDGSLVVAYHGQVIAIQEAPPSPGTLRARKGTRGQPPVASQSLVVEVSPVPVHPNGAQGNGVVGLDPDHKDALRRHAGSNGHKPKPDHPWRKSLLTKSLNN